MGTRMEAEWEDSPAARPSWATEDLVTETIRTWQPLTNDQFASDTAESLLVVVDQLFEVTGLAEPDDGEDEK